MATTFHLHEGGIITCAVGPPVEGTDGPRLLRLETFGREHQVKVTPLYLHPGEVMRLALELARRLPSEQMRAVFSGELNEMFRRKIPRVEREDDDAGDAGGEGGSSA